MAKKQKKSPMEKLVSAYQAKQSLRLNADEVQQLIDRDGGLSGIVCMFDSDNPDHDEFMRDGLNIMRGSSS